MADRIPTAPVNQVPPLSEQHRHGGHRLPHGQHGTGAYAAAGEHGQAAAHADAASVLGIPEDMLTEEVRAAIARLMAELDHRRELLDHERHHALLLDEAAHRHHLLPLLDRRGMGRAVAKLAAHVAQGGLGGAFVLLHVGGVERLRLTEGLAAAEAALRHVADILSDGLREGDAVAAMGGSDFALLLPLAEASAAAAKAAALAERVNRPAFAWRGGTAVLPVTHGAVPVEAESSLATLLAAADAVRGSF